MHALPEMRESHTKLYPWIWKTPEVVEAYKSLLDASGVSDPKFGGAEVESPGAEKRRLSTLGTSLLRRAF